MANSSEETQKRFDNMIRAKKIVLLYGLNLLVIPKAKIFELRNEKIIVEEFLDIPEKDKLCEQWQKARKSSVINEALKQLTILVAKTGLTDLAERNLPIINNRQIGLIDLEQMGFSRSGIFGHPFLADPGLLSFLNKEQQLLVLEEALQQGIIDQTELEERSTKKSPKKVPNTA